MKVGIVAEGPTDYEMIRAIINKQLPHSFVLSSLQPKNVGGSFGDLGTGWKGVSRWCQETQQKFGSLSQFIADQEIGLLVIQVDADIVRESDLQTGQQGVETVSNQPCPPIAVTIEKLRLVVQSWLGLKKTVLSEIVLIFPAQDSENWLFAGLFPDDPLCQQVDYECLHERNSRKHPAYLLTLSEYGRLLRRSKGKIKKSTAAYRRVLPQVMNAWERVCAICSQAQAFDSSLEAFQSSE